MLSKMLDAIYDAYPDQPEWAEIATLAYQAENPVELTVELVKALYLMSEDYAAFVSFMHNLKD